MLLPIQIFGEEGGSEQVNNDRKEVSGNGGNVKDRATQGEKTSLMEEAHSRRARGQDLKDRRTRSCQEGLETDTMSGEKKKPLSS